MKRKHALFPSIFVLTLLLCLFGLSTSAQARAGGPGVAINPHCSNIYPYGQHVLFAYDRSTGKQIPNEELVWSSSDPSYTLTRRGKDMILKAGPEGTSAVITVEWNGYTDQCQVHSLSWENQISFTMVSVSMSPGGYNGTKLMKDKLDAFGSGYQVSYRSDDPSVVEIEPDEFSPLSVYFTALDYGEATIIATATWPDGTQRETYCDVYVFSRGQDGSRPGTTPAPDGSTTPKPEQPKPTKPEPPKPEPPKPEPPQPSGGLRDSGSKSLPKLSRQEIQQLLDAAPSTFSGEPFLEAPSCSAPYAPGRLSPAYLQAAIDRLNALRRIAGLPDVRLDENLCGSSQYGAVICAQMGTIDHHPPRPADMENSFYHKACRSTGSSNLAAGGDLIQSVDMWMDDSDSSNIDCLGHRRWQLNPSMGKTGFGYAESDRGYRRFAVEYSFDNSGSGCAYDFLAWPASGAFPAEVFDGQQAWSVTPNPEQYQLPSASSIQVQLTRESDGKSWSFGARGSDGYFNVDTAGYGAPGCIIFRPDGVQDYQGTYQVSISGLRSKSGQPVGELRYQVEFFGGKAVPVPQPEQPQQPQKPEQPQKPQQPQQPQKPTAGSSFTDISSGHWAKAAIEQAVAQGVVNGYPDGSFKPTRSVTSAHFNAMLARAFHPEELYDAGSSPWWTPNVEVNAAHGILSGTRLEAQKQLSGAYGSRLNDPLCRYDMAQMMYNVLKDQGKAQVSSSAKRAAQAAMADWSSIPASYQDAVSACYALDLLKGQSNGAFGGENSMNRAQACVVIARLMDHLNAD